MTEETLTIAIEADTQGFEEALKGLEKQATSFGDTIGGALKSAIKSGKSFEDTLRSIGLSLADSALSAGMAPLQNIMNGFGAKFMSGLANVTPFAKGGLTGGGIVASPTYFPNTDKIGLMGEAGPEAILPLKRGNDGSLGIATSNMNASGTNHVTVNISTPDIESFQRSSAQVKAALTRAVARGRRGN